MVQFSINRNTRSLRFKPITERYHPCTLPQILTIDQLWYFANIFSKLPTPRPNLSGYMQSVTGGTHPPPSKITMVPIIDLVSSNYSCLYPALLHIIEQSQALNITPSVAFDLPF